MKKTIFIILFISSFTSNIIAQAVIADPALTPNTALPSQIIISTIAGTQIDPLLVPKDIIVKLKVPVYNLNIVNGIPQATTKIKIALGPRLELDPGFNLATMNTSAYFSWTRVFDGYEDFITGVLISALPANFSDSVILNIRGKSLTLFTPPSIIVANFLVTNNNPNIILSDENGSNNGQSLNYKVVEAAGPVPVTFTKVLTRMTEGCNIKVNFDTENEINVARFEIEISKDAVHYEKLGTLDAGNAGQYNFTFSIPERLKAPQLFIRIKSIDLDGSYQYSETRTVAANCFLNPLGISIFPNPVEQQKKEITIQANEHFFNGQYTIILFDVLGKLIHTGYRFLHNVNEFNHDISNLAPGHYILKLQQNAGTPYDAIKFQRR